MKYELVKDLFKKEFQKRKSLVANTREGIWRLETRVEQLDLIEWLCSQPHAHKIYWSDRDNHYEIAAVGEVRCFKSTDVSGVFSEIEKFLKTSPREFRLYGGLRFDPGEARKNEWQEYGNIYFFLPKFEIIQNGEIAILAYYHADEKCEMDSPDWNKFESDFRQIQGQNNGRSRKTYNGIQRHDFPDRKNWATIFDTASAIIRKGDLQKIVLARKSLFKYDQSIDPLNIFIKLRNRNQNTFQFFYQLDTHHAFLGATPERLFYRKGRFLKSEAIAGTCAVKHNPRENEMLKAQLLSSDKDLREHRWVSLDLEKQLQTICRNVYKAEKEEVLPLSYVQHLYTKFEAELKPNISDARIIESLHPTPAVAGYPRDLSVRTISRLENFDRGWYAGPIGWVKHDEAEFGVALRSALIRYNEMHVYAGAGIVEGSDAEKEWQEIESKIVNYTNLLS